MNKEIQPIDQLRDKVRFDVMGGVSTVHTLKPKLSLYDRLPRVVQRIIYEVKNIGDF